MLTKQDLSQIASLLKPIKTDVSSLKTDVSSLKTDVSSLKTGQTRIEKNIRKIQKDQKTIVNYFDHEYLSLYKDVNRINLHLGLSPQN